MADDLASVSVSITFEDFDEELRIRLIKASRAAAEEAEKEFSKSGKKSGKKFADEFVDDSTKGLRRAKGDFGKAGDESGKSFGDAFTKIAKKKGDESGGFFGDAFKAALQRIIGKGGLILSVAVPGAPAAIAAVTTLAGAVGQLVGVSGLLPGVLGSAAASLAVVKIGTIGVSDAFKALSGDDAEKLNEALKKLAPNARSFVLAIDALRPAFDALRLDVQQNLFQGLGESLTQLATVALPILRTGLSQIATSLSSLGGTLLTSFQTPAALAALQSILANTRDALINLQPAIAPVVAAFSTLASVGSSFLPGLSKSIADVAERFNNFVQQAAVSGALQDFIQGGIDAVKSLGATIGNVVEIFSGLARAGAGAGVGLFAGLEQITQALADFVNSAEGQDILGTILTNVAAGAKLIGQTIGPLLPALLQFATAFQSVTAAITPLLPVLGVALAGVIRSLAPVLASLAGPLAQVAAAVAPLITTLGTALSGIVTSLAPVISLLADGLAGVLVIVAGAVTQLLPVITQLVAVFASAMLPVIAQLVPVVTQFVGQLVAGLLPIITTLTPVIAQIAVAFGQVLLAFVQLLPSLLPLLPPLAQLSLAMAQLVVAIAPLVVFVAQLAVQLIQFFAPAIAAAVPLVTSLINVFVRMATSLATVLTAVVSFTISATNAIIGWVNTSVSFVAGLPGKVVGFLSSMASSGLDVLSGFVTSAAALASKVASGIVNAIKNGLSGLAGVFRAPFDNAKTAVSNALSGILSTVEGFISRISGAISKISSAISSIPRPNFPGIDIPGFANGTIATRPTLGVFGEAGAEAVIPLTRPKRALELMDKSGLLDLALSAGKAGGKPGKSKEIHMPIYAQGVSAEAVVDLIETKLGVRFGPSIGIDTSAGVI